MDEPDRLGIRDWVRALLRVRALWPLPALFLLACLLLFAPPEAWRPQYTTRRTLAVAELSIVISLAGTVSYWLVLVLSNKGLFYTGRSPGMREPTDAELYLVEIGTRWMCLFMAYAGPALLIWAPP